MEWYYIFQVTLGVLSLATLIIGFILGLIWKRISCIDKKLSNHLTAYGEFFGRVDTTIKFFKDHFKELDEAINQKKDEK